MRIATFAVVVGGSAVSGEPMGCPDTMQGDPVTVTWSIPDGPGDRGIIWRGCEVERGSRSGEVQIAAGWHVCTIQAWRKDGKLEVTTAEIDIDSDTTQQHIDFDLPTGPIGGMGATIYASYGGVRIGEVLPGTPAQAAGIESGDVVVSVDGVSAVPMSSRSFVRAVTGLPGTEVALRISGADGLRTVVIERARIP